MLTICEYGAVANHKQPFGVSKLAIKLLVEKIAFVSIYLVILVNYQFCFNTIGCLIV